MELGSKNRQTNGSLHSQLNLVVERTREIELRLRLSVEDRVECVEEAGRRIHPAPPFTLKGQISK